MEEFPPNTRSSREPKKKEPEEAPDEKKMEKVVTGKVTRRKKPLGKRIMETFFGGDTKGVGGYVVQDVLVPAAKDMVSDAVTQAIERMLFGDVRGRPGSSRRSSGIQGRQAHVSYDRMARPPARREDPRDSRREYSRNSRAAFDFDQIVLDTKVEAEEVLDQLFEAVSKYNSVTVAELYAKVGITPEFTDESWGWTELRGADVTRIKGGYLLDLPRPEPLN